MCKNFWKNRTSWDTVCRRASGRRGYNAHRKFVAAWRRTRVSDLLVKWGFEYGVQARIAKELGVSEATISRDMAVLMANSRPCPCCGRGVAHLRDDLGWQRHNAILEVM